MMYLKRDPLVHQSIENKVSDLLVLKLLFYEMTFNVLYGLYPCNEEEAAHLAAVHLRLTHGEQPSKTDVLCDPGRAMI